MAAGPGQLNLHCLRYGGLSVGLALSVQPAGHTLIGNSYREAGQVFGILGGRTLTHYFTFNMAPKSFKASKVLHKRSKAKVMEWVTKEYSRGTRDIAVEVSTSKGRSTPRANSQGIDNNEAMLHETTLPSMDADETFWTDEPAMDEPKRVSTPTHPS